MTLRAILISLLMLPAMSHAQDGDLQRFVIDAEHSWIRILVYRSGLMSGLGHNHVVETHRISGTVDRGKQMANSKVELKFPVDSLVVDDADLRELEGKDFSGKISGKDIQGTRENMLGRRMLDAENFPVIQVQSIVVESELDALSVTADVTVAGNTSSITFPASVDSSGDLITLSGSFVIRLEELGLKPYSAAFGLLKVRQDITVRFEISAIRQ